MTTLSIEIVSDVVCPWCFIGTRRLAGALAILRGEDPALAVSTRWRPFFLNPDTPPEGEPYRPFLEKKFGGMAQVEALWERVRGAGRSVGIEFAFETIQVRPNTLQAHRLLHWAQGRAGQQGDAAARVEALAEGLFAANFLQGENVGDAITLQRIAAACGYDAAAVAAYLASDADVESVRALEREARALGVRSVPTYLVNGNGMVTGAETAEVLAAAFRPHVGDGRPA